MKTKPETGEKLKLPDSTQTALIFGARYTHDRQTAGAYACIRGLKDVWDDLSGRVKVQIAEESNEAIYNKGEWGAFREWAQNQKPTP